METFTIAHFERYNSKQEIDVEYKLKLRRIEDMAKTRMKELCERTFFE